MNERAKQLAELGRKAYEKAIESTSRDLATIEALAVMLSAPAPRKGKKDESAPTLPFSPGELHKEMKDRAGHIVLCEPVESRLFGFMGKRLQGITGLERADLDRVVDWIQLGGLSWWTMGRPTFEHACNNIGKWIMSAREWDRRGRPQMKKGQLGPSEVGADVSGAFK